MTDKQLREEIVAAIDIIFTIVDDEGMTMKELAEASNLSLATVYRCWGCTFKKSPQFLTIIKLCHAVNIKFNFFEEAHV